MLHAASARESSSQQGSQSKLASHCREAKGPPTDPEGEGQLYEPWWAEPAHGSPTGSQRSDQEVERADPGAKLGCTCTDASCPLLGWETAAVPHQAEDWALDWDLVELGGTTVSPPLPPNHWGGSPPLCRPRSLRPLAIHRRWDARPSYCSALNTVLSLTFCCPALTEELGLITDCLLLGPQHRPKA